MNIEERFDELRKDSIEADKDSLYDCRVMEPVFQNILQLVLKHPEKQTFFVNQFIKMVKGLLNCPYELVPYCMRELRYPEVLQAAHSYYDELLSSNQHARYMNYCSNITKAYEDFIWEEAIMWQYYTKKELVPENVPILAQRLSNPDPQIQFNTLYALEFIGPAANNALSAIDLLLQREDLSKNVAARARLARKAITSSKPTK